MVLKITSKIVQEKCLECGSEKLLRDSDMGEIVCRTCGLVINEYILDKKPEWRAFTLEEKESKMRVGPRTSYSQFDKSLYTTFQSTKDASGRNLPWKTRLQMMRLRKRNIRTKTQSSFNRNLSKAMSELRRLSDKLNIPSKVQETAAIIYRRALRKNLVQGRSIKALVAASLYAACRQTKTSRTLKEVTETSLRDKNEITRNYRLLLRVLDIKPPIDSPLAYISKIASKAGISQKVQVKAIKLLREAENKKLLAGKGPVGVAAAALYIACLFEGENMTQKTLADVAGVTEVTVRNRYKGLVKDLKLIVEKGKAKIS